MSHNAQTAEGLRAAAVLDHQNRTSCELLDIADCVRALREADRRAEEALKLLSGGAP